MFCKKLFKSFKKNSSLIVFFVTLLYFFYTYVSLFLFVFNNALFYLFVNITLFYLCFHFVVRALTYPGSLLIYFHKTNYDNRVELCKFYMKESVKLSLIISDIRANAKEVIRQENNPRENLKIKLEQLFSNTNNKDNYFNFFSGLYIFYTLYISYYLYINIEENADFSDEQLLFYYYLKLFMIKINELKVYIHQEDVIYPEILIEIKIHKDFNEAVHQFILSRNPTYEKFIAPTRERGKDSSFQTAGWRFNIWKRLFSRNCVQDCKAAEEYANLLPENGNENNSKGSNGNRGALTPGRNPPKGKEKPRNYSKGKKGDKISDDSKGDNSAKDIIPPNYIDINILSLFYHENYEKSITHVNYRDFFMIIKGDDFQRVLDDLTYSLNKLGELFKVSTQRESMELRNITKYINDYIKKHIAGTMDLFKYELIFKYYGKQEYLLVNGAKIDCMFIPCKRFLNDKMQSYLDLKKRNEKKGARNGAEKEHLTNAHTNGHVYLNAFNNNFYNYIYQDDYLCDIPVVLYFNPNAAYYELNACYSGCLKFYIENNVNVFVYNYRGYSKSSGYPNLNRNNSDALKIAEYLLSKRVKHLGLHGTSIGGPLCSYVSYHLCNFNQKNDNMEYMDKLYKNEISIKITCKQINKMVKLMSRRKDKILNILLIPMKYIILLLQFIVLCKLKISNVMIRRKISLSLGASGGGGPSSNRDHRNNYHRGGEGIGTTRTHHPRISFVCIDKSFYNFEEVAKYMVGEYAYNILQFTSYKLDITKYYLNSNVPRILIFDNNDEIIHYMSSVVTGVSKEISKLYKSGDGMARGKAGGNVKSNAGGSPSLAESSQNLLPLVGGTCDDGEYIQKTSTYSDLYAKKRALPEMALPQREQLRNRSILGSPNEKLPFVPQLIIDESVDKCWFENKVKKIDIGLFLQSWKVINDCILFLNKSSTTNNSFISIGLQTYKSIISLYNSKENNLEKQTHNAIYCIYNDNMSFMDTFKKVNPNYDDFGMDGSTDKDSHAKKPNVCDTLRENEDFKFEMEKLNKMLKDLYMSKRKEVEKVHFTYSGFFLKNDYLYNYINTKNKKKEEPAFNIEEADIINFLKKFSDSLTQIADAINYNLNSCGQSLAELNQVAENEKINFFKSFIFRMKVYGSYPSQCFIPSHEEQYCNSIHQLPFILSECCDQGGFNPHRNVRNNSYHLKHPPDEEPLFDGEYPNSDSEDVYFRHRDPEKRTTKDKGERIKDTFHFNPRFGADYNGCMLPPYVVIKRSMFLHDLVVCLNWFKNGAAVSSPSSDCAPSTPAGVFYQLDEDTYLVNPTQLLLALKAKKEKGQNSQKNNAARLNSGNFLDLFSNDIGVDINDADFSKELEKYVSWMRLNNRMSLLKILLSLKSELRKMKSYSESLIDEYSTINQGTDIHFIIFLIYRILIFKKLLTHTYIIYTFWERLITSLDANLNHAEEVARNVDLLTLEPISHFDVFYSGAYKVYSPKILGCPLLVNCGHNGTLTKEDLSFFSTCLNFYLKEYT
ncbi:hypothetical protein C922_00201 [Plasmodium inui San Antonio 1]|uniref:Alpha/beta hydrolase n=1 Tax=Plasmodium inui San Antonio 1 TaxID=1237626 RepID=W7ADD7_9APIC|nr:hypothetical protein C922_00201 [Plasmodium inui San Antonio 1]EUD69338.1 hypothetical protein C922_00201 [Plasmodium inui San Antonio 1]